MHYFKEFFEIKIEDYFDDNYFINAAKTIEGYGKLPFF